MTVVIVAQKKKVGGVQAKVGGVRTPLTPPVVAPLSPLIGKPHKLFTNRALMSDGDSMNGVVSIGGLLLSLS
jgi:hypothetical protein